MSNPPDKFSQRVRIFSLCPLCGQVCLWYRQPQLLYGVCADHGRVQEAPISPLTAELELELEESSAPAITDFNEPD